MYTNKRKKYILKSNNKIFSQPEQIFSLYYFLRHQLKIQLFIISFNNLYVSQTILDTSDKMHKIEVSGRGSSINKSKCV